MPVVLNLSYEEATYLERLLHSHLSAGVDRDELETIHRKLANYRFPRQGNDA